MDRFLETETETDLSGGDEDLLGYNESTVLRNTLRVYGGLFLILFVLFCYLRRRFPRAYNVRSWAEDIKTHLADDQYGFFSWTWNLLLIPEDDILDECGMDALCFNRILLLGSKLALMGMFNAIWLLPLYASAKESSETAYITDSIVSVSVSHVPSESRRLVGTVLANYLIFGYAMHLILKEFQWFTAKRSYFLSKTLPRNYTVYVQGIPEEYRSNAGLVEYFGQCFSNTAVLDAQIALKTPTLQKLVATRESIVAKLEHAINVEEVKGISPKHRNLLNGGELVNSIDCYCKELRELNDEVAKRIEAIESGRNSQSYHNDFVSERRKQSSKDEVPPPSASSTWQDATESSSVACDEIVPFGSILDEDRIVDSAIVGLPGYGSVANDRAASPEPEDEDRSRSTVGALGFRKMAEVANATASAGARALSSGNKGAKKVASTAKAAGGKVMTAGSVAVGFLPAPAEQTVTKLANSAANAGARALSSGNRGARFVASAGGKVLSVGNQNVRKLASSAVAMLTGSDEGEPFDAGFVSFTSLRTTQAALQMLHHPEPYTMKVFEAPSPDDIFWDNVGKTHEELQVGKVMGISLTVVLCFLWTIPMSFIASLSSVDSLKEEVEFVEKAIETSPWLEPLLRQLAPLLLLLVNELLPSILERLSQMEGPVSGAVVQASTFTKLASFMIVQTFFVSAISGGLLSEISNILNEPTKVVDLLANSLPAQSTYFIQILLVDTFLSMAIELLRVIPVTLAWIRAMMLPNLTEKERNTRILCFRPFSDPYEFEHAFITSQMVLYFMVFFVYTAIAPITNFFMGICFLMRASAYRHQFVYIYPAVSDSGGKLWTGFIKIALGCMLVAQVTMVGLLTLKKGAIATPLMFPLIVATVLFIIYINREHFAATEHLSSRDCLRADLANGTGGGLDFSFVKGKYIQPELKDKLLLPENMSVSREIQHGATDEMYFTPDPSEAGSV